MGRPIGLAGLAAAFDRPDWRTACACPAPRDVEAGVPKGIVASCNRPAGHAGAHLVTDRTARVFATWAEPTIKGPPRRP